MTTTVMLWKPKTAENIGSALRNCATLDPTATKGEAMRPSLTPEITPLAASQSDCIGSTTAPVWLLEPGRLITSTRAGQSKGVPAPNGCPGPALLRVIKQR